MEMDGLHVLNILLKVNVNKQDAIGAMEYAKGFLVEMSNAIIQITPYVLPDPGDHHGREQTNTNAFPLLAEDMLGH